jgi:hypothetical protein
MSTTQADTDQTAREDATGHSPEWIQGAETAAWRTDQLAGRGHSAAQVAQAHEDHHGDRDEGDWDAGYQETAAHDVQELRELQDRDAEDRAAAREREEPGPGGYPAEPEPDHGPAAAEHDDADREAGE